MFVKSLEKFFVLYHSVFQSPPCVTRERSENESLSLKSSFIHTKELRSGIFPTRNFEGTEFSLWQLAVGQLDSDRREFLVRRIS